VDRSDLEELHLITPIANMPSILKHGILCKRRAKPLKPVSIAMEEVQAIRANRAVPGGRPLHDYANLYICARNPMLYKRRSHHLELCVLRVDPAVLNHPGVVIADGNAASSYTAFWPAPAGLAKVDRELVFAEYWTDSNQILKWHKARVKCAEVLVPDRVEPRFIVGAYISCQEVAERLRSAGVDLTITIDGHLFFLG